MSTITPEELFAAWKLEQASVEMAIGQTLQNLVKQQAALEVQNRALLHLRADVDRWIVHMGLTPNDQGKTKPSQLNSPPKSTKSSAKALSR